MNPNGGVRYVLVAGPSSAKAKLMPETPLRKHSATYTVPYSPGGSLLRHATSKTPDVTWLANDPFTRELKLLSEEYSEHSVWYIWEDPEGRTFPMFRADLPGLVWSGLLVHRQRCRALWVPVKRGPYFGVRALGEPQDD